MDQNHSSFPVPVGSGLPTVLGGLALLPTREIVVNNRRCVVRADSIDHGQLVRLAFPDATEFDSGSTSLTVSYRGGPHSASSGILAPTERTLLADGETFIVVRTDKS